MRGLSPIEVFCIIAILGILAVLVAPNVLRYLGY